MTAGKFEDSGDLGCVCGTNRKLDQRRILPLENIAGIELPLFCFPDDILVPDDRGKVFGEFVVAAFCRSFGRSRHVS